MLGETISFKEIQFQIFSFAILDDRLYKWVEIVSIVHLSLHKIWIKWISKFKIIANIKLSYSKNNIQNKNVLATYTLKSSYFSYFLIKVLLNHAWLDVNTDRPSTIKYLFGNTPKPNNKNLATYERKFSLFLI